MRTIAFLGPENTNTHLAARQRFGARARYIHAPTIEDVFRLVEREEAHRGLVPVENSLEGAVTHTLDRFIDFKQSPVRICGEIEQSIHHSLIVHQGTSLSRIAVVFSHPQALAQCDRWLQQHVPAAQRWETHSTAEAVTRIISAHLGSWGLRERAAIARKDLVRRGLRAVPIPNERVNKTRFLVIGLGSARRSRRSKTSVLFALKDKPGALHDALVPFKRHRINLTKIESRPSKRKVWEYVFFIDCVGHERDLSVQRALRALRSRTAFVRVLGSYPVAK